MTNKRAARIIYQSGEEAAIELILKLASELRLSRKTIAKLERRIQVFEDSLSKNSLKQPQAPVF